MVGRSQIMGNFSPNVANIYRTALRHTQEYSNM